MASSEIPQKRFLGLNKLRDMEMVRGLPLVVVIERRGKRQIYRIDKPENYWSNFEGLDGYLNFEIEEAENLCAIYGTPISKEEFSKAKVLPAFQRCTSDWSYEEFRANFE